MCFVICRKYQNYKPCLNVIKYIIYSTDYGVNFENITDTQHIREVVKKHNGLQRHPLDPKRVSVGFIV